MNLRILKHFEGRLKGKDKAREKVEVKGASIKFYRDKLLVFFFEGLILYRNRRNSWGLAGEKFRVSHSAHGVASGLGSGTLIHRGGPRTRAWSKRI
jgi:hypothetical protein